MITPKQVEDLLKKEGTSLSDKELELVVQVLISLAKIEYEVYRQQKSEPVHGQFSKGLEIGVKQKIAS